MKKLLTAMALASTALSAPAFARDGAMYVEVDGGVMKVEDFDFDIAGVKNAVKLDNDTWGYDFGGIVGYDFGPFRLEGEVGYRGVSNDQLKSTVFIPATNTTVTGRALPGSYDAGGDSTVLSLMLNGLVDVGQDDGLQFFAGGGVGKAKIDVNTSINSVGPGFVNDHDWTFAWQALAGVRAPLSDNIDVGVKYRYFNASGFDLNDTAGRAVKGDWRSHSLMGTFAVNFGGREPMMEPVAAPPPPPPPTYTPPPAPVYTPPPPPPEPPVKSGERG
ncbi:outer membrane protein [Novosphingobium tardum]|uniref:Outer membrane protein n=1 Tax=Novosphingobium tardum TaxID=1538021 RepID=A0ABV8RPR1_9SPHN